MMHNGGNDAKLKTRLSKSSPFEVKMLVEFIRRGISGVNNILRLAISEPIEKREI